MNKTVIEVKSATWKKWFISILAIFLAGSGIVCWSFAFLMGLFLMAIGFGIWWPVMRSYIRADETGISQTNGFFHQSLNWDDVAYYYIRSYRTVLDMGFEYVEPVLFNSKNQIIFCPYTNLVLETTDIMDQRRVLWQFVEAQLQGKKIDAPSAKPFPNPFGWKILDVNWPVKSWKWKFARFVTLIVYALFWCCVLMAPLFYIVTRY